MHLRTEMFNRESTLLRNLCGLDMRQRNTSDYIACVPLQNSGALCSGPTFTHPPVTRARHRTNEMAQLCSHSTLREPSSKAMQCMFHMSETLAQVCSDSTPRKLISKVVQCMCHMHKTLAQLCSDITPRKLSSKAVQCMCHMHQNLKWFPLPWMVMAMAMPTVS